MRVFLTGGSGILGTAILKQLQLENHEVLAFDSTDIDLTDLVRIEQQVNDFNPDVVVHSAAMTNVDLCETQQDLAYSINVTGTENMAIAAAKHGALMVYISSCGVYGNGKTTPWHETDETNPLNYHHFTKLEGEKVVKKHHAKPLIIRPGWLFGGSPEHKKNFVEARRKEAFANTTALKSAFDKSGSPTYTTDVAKQLIYILNEGITGTFNIVNEGEATRFSYVSEIVNSFNLLTKVEPVNSNLFPRPAKMPDNECLENRNLNLNNCNRMRHWKLALKEYINTNY